VNDETRSVQTKAQPENKSAYQHAAPTNHYPEVGSVREPRKGKNAAHSKKAKQLALWIGLAFLILFAIGFIPRLVRGHRLAEEKKNQADNFPPVTVIRAQGVPTTIDVELSGTMSALTEAPLLARANGYLVKRLVDIGDLVHRGELLAVISSPDFDQQVLQARAALQESQSAFDQSQSALDQSRANNSLAAVTAQRWARLQERGAVSRQENDTYQTNFQAQTASVAASEANVRTASHNIASSQANLQRLVELQAFEQIRAPFDGVVTERDLDVGALIATGSTVLYRVAQIDVLRTYINVPQTNAPAVASGQPVSVSFAEYPARTFEGTVTRLSDSLDPATRTMLTEVQLPNRDRALLPGMFANVRLTLPRTGSAVLVPGESLIVRAEGTLVGVVDEKQTIHLHKVNVGHDYGNTIEVLGGLSAGENVIANPDDNVVDGAHVRPVQGKQTLGNPPNTGGGTPGSAPSKSQPQPQSKAPAQPSKGGSPNEKNKSKDKNQNGGAT
jgi:RND family efflux transporter MFP subunit